MPRGRGAGRGAGRKAKTKTTNATSKKIVDTPSKFEDYQLNDSDEVIPAESSVSNNQDTTTEKTTRDNVDIGSGEQGDGKTLTQSKYQPVQ